MRDKRPCTFPGCGFVPGKFQMSHETWIWGTTKKTHSLTRAPDRCRKCYYGRKAHDDGVALMPLGTMRCDKFVSEPEPEP